MTTPKLRRPLLEVFTAVLPLGADSKKKEDALSVTQVLKHLHPDMSELVIFEAHQHFWHCPGCQAWDSYPPRRVEEL